MLGRQESFWESQLKQFVSRNWNERTLQSRMKYLPRIAPILPKVKIIGSRIRGKSTLMRMRKALANPLAVINTNRADQIRSTESK